MPSASSPQKPAGSWGRLRRATLFCVLSVPLLLQGCTSYHPRPLDQSAVAKALRPPSAESIRIQAGKIRHPILKPVAIDFKKGLSADEVAIIAVISNPALRVERDRRGIATAQLFQAGILPNPAVGYSLDLPTGGSTQGTINAYGFTLDWDLLRSLVTRGARTQAARAHAASIDLAVAWKEWQVAESAKRNVYRIVFLEKQLAVAREEENKLGENLEVTRKAVSLGDMTILDLEAADAAVQKAHTVVLDLSRRLQEAQLSLNALLGLEPEAAVPLQKKLESPFLHPLPSLQELTAGLESRRLDLLALRMGYQSQEARLREAVRAQFPSIGIGVDHARDTSNVITTGFSVSIDLPFFDHNQGRIAIEKATRRQLFDEYVSRVFKARARTARLLTDMRSIEAQIDAAHKVIISLKKLVRTSHNGFLEGNIDALSYYNELDKLFSKQLDILQLRQDLADSGIALEITAGRVLGVPANKKGGAGE